MDEFDEFLDGKEQPEAPVEATPEPEATEAPEGAETPTEGQPRDATGKFAPKGEDDAPPASEEKAVKGQEAAIVAERRKRQEAQERMEKLERQIAEMQQPQQQAQKPPPSMWEDEQAWQNHFGGQVVNTAVQQATQNAKLDMSEMMARQNHEDFDDVKASFLEMAKANPALAQQALQDPHPWNRAYQIAKNAKTMEELGATDMETLKAQLREQIAAEQVQAQQETAKPKIPQSLAGEQSARGSAAPNAGPLSLDDILKG